MKTGSNRRNTYPGVYTGLVIDNKDPEGLGRIKVKFPFMGDDETGFWCRLSMPMAGAGKGVFFLPEKDEEVLVAFENGDISRPYILGVLWNSKEKPPEKNEDGENNLKKIVTRSGHVISLNDKEGSEKIEIIDKSGQNSITFDTVNNTISIKTDKDISLEAPNGLISLKAKNIELSSTEDTKVNADTNIEIKSESDTILSAANIEMTSESSTRLGAANIEMSSDDSTKVSASSIEISSNSTTKVKAQAGLNLESSAITTIKGSIVNIN